MKIALSQLDLHIGNFEDLSKMLAAVTRAEQQGADLICFPELAVVVTRRATSSNLMISFAAARLSIKALQDVSHNIAIVVGAPTRNPVIAGKDLYNLAYFLYGEYYRCATQGPLAYVRYSSMNTGTSSQPPDF